ncbi:MAG: VanZ family protein [Clostridia bacterium]|nr:VanZ family protein [Clostridia bacterium]
MKLRKFILPIASWIAVILWMSFIFCMSAQPAPESKETSDGVSRIILKILVRDFEELPEETKEAMIENIQHFVRKSAHFCGYALLGILLLNAFSRHIENTASVLAISQLCGMTYAASDELHQRFVPGRSGEIKDIALDSAGVFCGIIFAVGLIYLIRRCKNRVR